MKMTTKIPSAITTPDAVETRLGIVGLGIALSYGKHRLSLF
jgi:hypothetical protein